MFDHVLVPLDFSALAEKALHYLPHMLSPDGQLTLLTVLDVPEAIVFAGDMHYDIRGFGSTLEMTQQQRRRHAKDYLTQVAERLGGSIIRVEKLVQIGHAPQVIADTAHRLGVQAIVMATHGRTGLSRWLHGSVTQQVLEAAPCPVLVVPSRVVDRLVED